MSNNDPQNKNGSSVVIIIVAILAGMFVMMLVCGGVGAALLLPAVQSAREAARRMQCSNNMKQIALALHNYESQYKTLPPAFTVDAQGNRLHSWRTLILPYLEQSALYDQIDFSKPWDHPDNAFALDREVVIYRCPSATTQVGFTTYLALVGNRGVFSGSEPNSFRSVTDGLANTLMVVEAKPTQAVHWMDPSDIDIEGYISSLTGRGSPGDHTNHVGGGNCAFGDGSVRYLSSSIDIETLRGLSTRNGGETVIAE
jgi:prepilin-type processing-associated H-X9-DG protein